MSSSDSEWINTEKLTLKTKRTKNSGDEKKKETLITASEINNIDGKYLRRERLRELLAACGISSISRELKKWNELDSITRGRKSSAILHNDIN